MVRKEGNYWRVQIQRGGVLHSTTRPTREEAQAYEAEVIAEWKHRRIGNSKKRSLSEAIVKWAEEELPRQKAAVATANHAAQLEPYIKNKSIEDIPEVWAEYKRDHPKLKAATINHKGAILRRIANLALKNWQWITTPIYLELLKVNNAREVYITKAQLDLLIDKCPCKETKALLVILYYTGMRIGEVLKAEPLGEVLVVSDTKKNKSAYIPMHKEVIKLVKFFPFKFGYHYYRKRFAKARDLAGMPELNLHDIRHSTASALIAAGATMVEVRDTLRHSSISTTNRYLHLCNEGVKKSIDRL